MVPYLVLQSKAGRESTICMLAARPQTTSAHVEAQTGRRKLTYSVSGAIIAIVVFYFVWNIKNCIVVAQPRHVDLWCCFDFETSG